MVDYTSEKLNPQDTARAYDYLIIGGGMVADTAARGIREKRFIWQHRNSFCR